MDIAAIGLFVAISGWLVSHGLSLRAQRRQFLNNVLNDARKDVVRAIRNEQDRLNKLANALWILEVKAGRTVDWTTEAATLSQLREETPSDLTTVLEEYENLFPKSVKCRSQLVKERWRLYSAAGEITGRLRVENTRAASLESARALAQEIQAFTTALDDLRVHIQNDTLGRMTGHEVPRRRLEDDRLQVVVGDGGHLELKRPSDGR